VPVPVDPAIGIRGLRVVRGGREVLPGIDLDVAAGRVTGLVGPSGSGKTTLMRAIVGVQVVAGGEITVLGEPAGTARLRERVAYMTQSGSVYPDLTAAENVLYLARLLGEGDAEVRRVIELVGLAGEQDRPVVKLSGGQRRRVSLAGALLGSPDLLVLDEPTVGLDPLLRRDLWELFARLRDAGATLLVSTHVLDEAGRCDEVVLLREGRLLGRTTAPELRRDTGTDDLDEAFVRLIEREDAAR
jgi:ABC-2 type transport system ATP-binding protein